MNIIVSAICIQQRKFIDAVKEFDKCLEIYPNYPEALYNRGITYIQLNQQKLACADIKKAADLGYQRAYYLLNTYCSHISELTQIKYFSKFNE